MMRKVRFRFILVSLLLTSLSAFAADWPHWRGPNYNGISSETGWTTQWPAQGPEKLWKASVGIGFSSIAVGGGRAYTMGNNSNDVDTVFCFDANTGKEIWKHSYDCPLDPKYFEGGTGATPTIDGDRVYTLSRKGDLFCFDAASGKIQWSTNIATELGAKIPTWGFAGSAFVYKDMLLLNVGTAGTALDKASGKVLWTSGKDEAGYSTFVPCSFGDKPAAAFFIKQAVVCVEIESGKQLWSYPWKTQYDVNAADPIVTGDKVFISSGYNHGCALIQVKDGKASQLWENTNMRNHINSCVLVDGYLYGIDGNAGPAATLNCLDLSTGAVKWSEKGLGGGSLIMADKKLIILSEKGELVIAEVSPQAFKPIARAQVLTGRCWTTPVLANGKIYCRNAKGDLVCVNVK